MTAQYAFHFDATSCSGCKACQVACKDKNNLPTGVLWRRVYEVSGGEWTQVGEAWTNTVFAYNLSMACNHCVHPKCAGVCPVDAYTVREDGIVYLDTAKCIGCGYCAWACPYAAPQYNPEAGHMSKCDFCRDNLDAGLPPACVAACPLRVLDFVTVNDGQVAVDGQTPLWEVPGTEHPFPLPRYSHTEPHLAIKSHAGMLNDLKKTISNREEIQPRKVSAWEEAPLMAFTLLSQMAVGGFWVMQWMFPPLWSVFEYDTSLPAIPALSAGWSLSRCGDAGVLCPSRDKTECLAGSGASSQIMAEPGDTVYGSVRDGLAGRNNGGLFLASGIVRTNLADGPAWFGIDPQHVPGLSVAIRTDLGYLANEREFPAQFPAVGSAWDGMCFGVRIADHGNCDFLMALGTNRNGHAGITGKPAGA